MAQGKIKYAKESLRFWWKNSTVNVGCSTALCYRSVGFCHQALRTQPLAETTWNALKENGLWKRTRGTRGGAKKANWKLKQRFSNPTLSFWAWRSFKSSRSKFAYHGSQVTANLNNLIQFPSSMTTNEAEHNKQSERTSYQPGNKSGLLFARCNARSLRNSPTIKQMRWRHWYNV